MCELLIIGIGVQFLVRLFFPKLNSSQIGWIMIGFVVVPGFLFYAFYMLSNTDATVGDWLGSALLASISMITVIMIFGVASQITDALLGQEKGRSQKEN